MDDFTTEFNGRLATHLERGHHFVIEVVPIDNPKRFGISLAKENLNRNPEADIGMQVVLNFVENRIFGNSRFGRDWINPVDERYNLAEISKHPIKFNIQMWEETFNIAINGEHTLKLHYCGNIHLMEAIQIEGDIKRISRLDHHQTYPQAWPPWYVPARSPDTDYFSLDLPAPIKQGQLVIMRIRCFGEMGRLILNTKHEREGKLLFHCSMRFDENVVVRNDMKEGVWGTEERDGDFPFDMDKDFRLGIACAEKAFELAVYGRSLCRFAYREAEGYNLSTVGGFNLHATGDLKFKITAIDHILMNSPQCKDFERLTLDENVKMVGIFMT